MASFIGGSAYAMATQIAEGYLLLNHTHLKKLTKGELGTLQHEVNKVLTEARGNQPPLDDVQAQQLRRGADVDRLAPGRHVAHPLFISRGIIPLADEASGGWGSQGEEQLLTGSPRWPAAVPAAGS